jgi:hypothetical protein
MAKILFAFLLLVATVNICAEERKSAPTTQPANPLLGRWEVVSVRQKRIPRELAIFWTVDDDHITVTDRQGERISRNAYRIDRSKDPPHFVMKVTGEKDRIGWFRLKDKELQLLLTVNTGKPPNSWEDGMLMVLRPIAKG